MKKKLFDPGFELIFATGVIAMLMLPSLLMAQRPPKTTSKQLKVIIQNNDTTINGKNIKQLSKADREKALKDIDDMGIPTKEMTGPRKYIDTTSIAYVDPVYGRQEINIPRIDRRWLNEHIRKMQDERPELADTPRTFSFRIDTGGFGKGKMRPPTVSWDIHTNNMDGFEPRMFALRGSETRNSQSFSYSNTNKDGFSTHVNYHASDANKETAKRITGADMLDLNINDLLLTPSFATGKTNLNFTIAEKGSAEVLFKDNEGKILWSDKANGAFSKSFDLPQNGIYYLQIKQGNKFGLRRIVKEQ